MGETGRHLLLAACLAIGLLASAACSRSTPTEPSETPPGSGPPTTGRLVVASDDWVLSDTAFGALPDDTARFARNLAAWLTGTPGQGRIHAYSDFFSYTGQQLASTLGGAGYTFTVGLATAFDLPTLSTFDAVMVGIPLLDAGQMDALSRYLDTGGRVYLHAGNGIDDPDLVPGTWNPLLSRFGIQLQRGFDGLLGPVTLASTHPLLEGVSRIYVNAGHPITGCCVVATAPAGSGLFAVSTN